MWQKAKYTDIFVLQEDVAYIKSGSLFKLVGFVNLGRSYENLNVLTTGNPLTKYLVFL